MHSKSWLLLLESCSFSKWSANI